jgi:hypothetical protein
MEVPAEQWVELNATAFTSSVRYGLGGCNARPGGVAWTQGGGDRAEFKPGALLFYQA